MKTAPLKTKTTTVTQEVEILFPHQLAERLGLKHIGTLANWRHLGKGPRYISGKPIRYVLADVEAWENSHKVSSTAEAR